MATPHQPRELSFSRLTRLFLPLALSWLMMAAEMPICTRFVNSLPDARVQLAGLLALFAVALFVESPVIDLLATSTTLAQSKRSFTAIRRFSLMLMVWCGVLHLLIAVTPLFDVVFVKILRLPLEVSEAVRLPMLILVPWSPAIGWRRHVQGLLIRSGETGVIGTGTLVRVCSIFLVAFLGYISKSLPGAAVAALALSVSVIVEAVFIHVAGTRILKTTAFSDDSHELSGQELASFHFPLAASTMVTLSALPMVSGSLALVPNPILAMNSWQVSTSLAFLMRTMTFALPEVVIANWQPGLAARLLSRFCMGIGIGLSALMLLMSAFGIDTWFFRTVVKADVDVSAGAHQAFLWCSILPILTAATSYVKGVLTRLKITVARLAATVASIAVLAAVLFIGVGQKWPGVAVAASALSLSQLAELSVLSLLLWLKSRGKEQLSQDYSA